MAAKQIESYLNKTWFSFIGIFFLLISMVLFSTPSQASELNKNLLINPGFEEMKDGIPAEWEAMNGWDNPEISLSNEAAHTGDVGIILQTDEGTNPWVRQEVFDLEEGAVYEATAYLKGVDFRNRGASIKIEFYTGEPGGETWIDGFSKRLESATGDWEKFTFTQQAPEGTKAARIYYRLRPSGEVHFDDVTFKKIAERPKIELDTNHIFYYPDLEEGTVQAELYQEERVYTDQSVDVLISNAESGEVMVEATDLQAEQYFEYTFDPRDMKLQESYTVKVDYKDTDGELLESEETTIYKWERPTALQEDGTMMVDGEPFFPVIGYHVRENRYADVHESINTVQGWLTTDNDDRMQNYLDEAEENGLKVLVPLYDNMQVKENFDRIERKVTKFKDHPAVLGWMLMDEPTTNGVSLDELVDAYKLIRSIDPVNPTYMVEASENHIEEKSKATDIIASNPYPLPNSPITKSGDVAQIAVDAAQGVKPVYTILQAFQLPPNYPYLPTIDEIRHMAYQSILEGVQGLGYYSFQDPNWDLIESELYPGIVDFTEKELMPISEFITKGTKLDQHKDDQVQWGLWELEDRLYAAVVNLTEEPQTTTISLPTEGYHVETLAPEYGQSSIFNDELTIDLSNLEVTLIKITPFTSSADLIEEIDRLEDEGAFANKGIARALKMHVTAVEHFENQEKPEKVIKHLAGFKQLLSHHQENGNISEKASMVLRDGTDAVIQKTMESLLHMTVQLENSNRTIGENIQLNVHLENTSHQTIEAPTLVTFWPEELGIDSDEQHIQQAIKPGESVEVTVEVEIPADVPVGEHPITTEVQFDYKGEALTYTRDQYVTVLPHMEAKINESLIDAKTPGDYPILLTMKNNASSVITVEVESEWTEGLELNIDSPVQIESGETVELEGTVTISSELPDGDYEGLIQLVVGGAPLVEIPLDVLLDKNLIPNPGFEEDASNPDLPEGWSLRSGERVQDEVHSGQYAVALTPDSENDWNVSTSAKISIDSGTAYRFSGWSKNESTTGGVEMGVREVDASGETVTYHWQETNANTDWTNYDIEFVPGNNTESIYIFMKVDQESDGRAWFDDFRLEEIPSTNLIQNAGFETLNNGNPEYWSATGGWQNDAIAVTTEEAYTGDHSLKIITESKDNYLATQTLDVKGGQSYEFSAWLKSAIESGGKAQFKVEFYQDKLGSEGYVDAINSEAFGSYDEWENVKMQVDIPDDANMVRIYVRLFGPGTAYYDDVEFRLME